MAKNSGRTGILVHGGSPGTAALLRRTNGCIRMMDSELAFLIQKIRELENAEDPCTRLRLERGSGIGSGPCVMNSTCGEGDPPH